VLKILYSSESGGKGGLVDGGGEDGLVAYSFKRLEDKGVYKYPGRYTKKFSKEITEVYVHAWGAGGAGGVSGPLNGAVSSGGGGGYVKCTVAVPKNKNCF
jgi:hypothetical protein